jgi:hypothetical protein
MDLPLQLVVVQLLMMKSSEMQLEIFLVDPIVPGELKAG